MEQGKELTKWGSGACWCNSAHCTVEPAKACTTTQQRVCKARPSHNMRYYARARVQDCDLTSPIHHHATVLCTARTSRSCLSCSKTAHLYLGTSNPISHPAQLSKQCHAARGQECVGQVCSCLHASKVDIKTCIADATSTDHALCTVTGSTFVPHSRAAIYSHLNTSQPTRATIPLASPLRCYLLQIGRQLAHWTFRTRPCFVFSSLLLNNVATALHEKRLNPGWTSVTERDPAKGHGLADMPPPPDPGSCRYASPARDTMLSATVPRDNH